MTPAPAWPWPFWLYRIGGEIGAPVIGAAVRYKYRHGERAAQNPQRFGHALTARPQGPLIWVHAASLGETRSVQTLLARLQDARPHWHFLLTHWTESAAGLASSADYGDHISAFFPIDTGPARRRFLSAWRPDAALFVESEIWPGWIDALYREDIPFALVNARLSEKSARNWSRWPRLARAMTARMDQILAQNQKVADRFVALGAEGEKVRVTGDLKSAAAPPEVDASMLARWQDALGTRPVWAAASTHDGEEEIILAAHATWRETQPDAALILIPRHPERAGMVEAMATARGLQVLRHSHGRMPGPEDAVILADGFGKMGLWYRLSRLVFMGGSLVDLGGHNPFEPARLHNALLSGPMHQNFAESYARFTARGGAEIVTADNLSDRLTALLASPELAKMAQAAADVANEAEDITDIVANALLGGALRGV